MEVTIEKKYDGMLLREFLRQELDLSRASITRLKQKQNGLLLNGLHVTVRAVLKTNDRLSLALEDTVEDENALLFPQDLPFQVLFEDRDILAVDKPAGMPTHPTRGHLTDTLANGVAFRFQNTGRPFVFRAINRLDRDTSGVVLIALNKAARWPSWPCRCSAERSSKPIQPFWRAVLPKTKMWYKVLSSV